MAHLSKLFLVQSISAVQNRFIDVLNQGSTAMRKDVELIIPNGCGVLDMPLPWMRSLTTIDWQLTWASRGSWRGFFIEQFRAGTGFKSRPLRSSPIERSASGCGQWRVGLNVRINLGCSARLSTLTFTGPLARGITWQRFEYILSRYRSRPYVFAAGLSDYVSVSPLVGVNIHRKGENNIGMILMNLRYVQGWLQWWMLF